MKKVITLVLAIALVLTSVVALADGTPNINSFATMKVKYHELKSEPWGAPAYWEITLSKPVDRLLINWSGKGEEPEELAVDENLKATALKGSHKYMPGTSQYYATWVSVNHKVVMDEVYLGKDICSSEEVYICYWSPPPRKFNFLCHNYLFLCLCFLCFFFFSAFGAGLLLTEDTATAAACASSLSFFSFFLSFWTLLKVVIKHPEHQKIYSL